MNRPDEAAAVLAAIAVCRADPFDLPAIRVMTSALGGDDEYACILAALGMLRANVGADDAMHVIEQKLPQLSDEACQYKVLTQLKQLGTSVAPLFNCVRALLDNPDAEPIIRQQAASCLGHMTTGTTSALDVLLPKLGTSDWRLLVGVIKGLQATGHMPAQMVDSLIPLLTHQDKEMRGVAAAGIGYMGKAAGAAVPTLIERLGEEPNIEVCQMLTEALGNAGEAAVAPLTSIIVNGDRQRAELAMQALARTGEQGCHSYCGSSMQGQ